MVLYDSNDYCIEKNDKTKACFRSREQAFVGCGFDDDYGFDEDPAAPLKSSLLASMGGHAFIFSRAASNCAWSKSKLVLTIFSGSPPRMSGVSPLP